MRCAATWRRPPRIAAVTDPQPPARSYSTAYVAQRLGVSVPTVQRWVDAGHLKAWKTPGGHRRIDADSADRLISRQPAEPAAPTAVPAGGERRVSVCIVDDNADDRDLLAAIVLEALPGAELLSFDNAIQALVAVARRTPDVLITDILMPHMDGPEMLRQIDALGSARPRMMVAVSASCDAHGAPLVALPPGVRFVPKPIAADLLLRVLRGDA